MVAYDFLDLSSTDAIRLSVSQLPIDRPEWKSVPICFDSQTGSNLDPIVTYAQTNRQRDKRTTLPDTASLALMPMNRSGCSRGRQRKGREAEILFFLLTSINRICSPVTGALFFVPRTRTARDSIGPAPVDQRHARQKRQR